MTDLTVEQQLDALTTRLPPPLRADKHLEGQALNELCMLVEQQRDSGFFDDLIPVHLAGKFWFVFWAMLAERSTRRPQTRS